MPTPRYIEDFRGLGQRPKKEWPTRYVRDGQDPLDYLKPGSKEHAFVRDYLIGRIEASERSMSPFYTRWADAERRYQAYIDLPEFERRLKERNDAGDPPLAVPIVLPVSFAIINTITTYMLHTFAGRKPIFQVGSYQDETVEASKNMEIVHQYHADHTRAVYKMFQSFQDDNIYGLSILRPMWSEEYAWRTRRNKKKKFSILGSEMGDYPDASREWTLTYQGNEMMNQDPFLFFPDPRVPLTEVSRRGEYVFWRSFEGRHLMLRAQAMGDFKWVEATSDRMPHNQYWFADATSNSSARALLSGGRATPAVNMPDNIPFEGGEYMQVDQGTCVIIPRELGLGKSAMPEKWIFTILNKDQIIQAQPFEHDHDLHPVAIAEPYSMGYGFGNAGLADYLAPIGDTVSWFINSHIDNVRKALNDVFVFDPSAIEQRDLMNPTAGKAIRLKRAAVGKDVRTVLQQLQVSDVTKGHIDDAQVFLRIGQMLSAITENVMGIQAEGGRKTATEVRTSAQAAVSRLASLCRIVSAQQMTDVTRMWSLNTLQFMDDDFFVMVLGREGQENPIRISPDMLNGDFYFPTQDGTLPADRIASFDIWKEILMGVMQDPQLRAEYSVAKIFEHVAELGGAVNIESMRTTPDEKMAAQAQAGNAVPMSEAGNIPRPSSKVRALPNRDAKRAQGTGTQGPGGPPA